MLNFDVKRKINTLRDILVGKVPDPKAQVEQITIALIYKFMDDMDLAGAEFGGKRVFFAGDYEKYAFTQIMLPEHSSQDRLNLYAEGIEKMVNNAELPQLFRDILRGAYIPYRDPETLNRFLKEIAEFNYDHSEDLGDSFEYLLSIMGSQGDAGQFRTPRHIIDMMVEIIAPRKNETVLDPACGTAGFLISAYKYIDKQNRDEGGKSTLSGEDRKRMADNFAGYDISPDMVRLSRVNMYLHGFSNPQISEYDTLTSLDKWDDTYDVILANPPFMTPKGGISPHGRYRVSAKRAEVLFVDYIAEHLTPTGRAAIVVPEGIVAQAQTAYRNLRRYLVEDNLLYAVISLPAGVFNPYSGVKTSILLIDKTIAKERDSILFVKLNNDGYDLGAQRREIKGCEIPSVINTVKEFQFGLELTDTRNVVLATKYDIAQNDYMLTGASYREEKVVTSNWPLVRVGDICDIQNGYAFSSEFFSETEGTPIIRIRDIKTNKTQTYYSGQYDDAHIVNDGDLLIGMDGEFNPVLWAGGKALLNQRVCRLRNFRNVLKEYVFYLIKRPLKEIEDNTYAVTVKHISAKQIAAIQIPIPPMGLQEEIIENLEKSRKVIDGAKQIIGNYQPAIKVDSEWDNIPMGDMYDISYGLTISIPQNEDENGIKIISTAEVGLDGSLDLTNIRKVKYDTSYKKFVLEPNTLLFNWRNAPKHVGKTALFLEDDDQYISASFLLSLKNKDPEHVDNRFIWCSLNNLRETGYFMRNARQAVNQANFNGDQLSKIVLKVPDIKTQRMIMDKIEEEMIIVEQNKRLIEIYEQKIADRIAEVWGE